MKDPFSDITTGGGNAADGKNPDSSRQQRDKQGIIAHPDKQSGGKLNFLTESGKAKGGAGKTQDDGGVRRVIP
jgi:hypothetical protein